MHGSFPLGEVVAHVGEPPDGNPYSKGTATASERVAALGAAYVGADTSRWSFWHAPPQGGSQRIADPSFEIDWTALDPIASARTF
jgi:hypothetical protein